MQKTHRPAVLPLSERRKGNQLLNYWNILRAGRRFPQEDELDPEALEGLWSNCFLIQRRDIEQVPYYNYSYMGENIIQAYEHGELGSLIPGLAAMDPAHLATEYQTVIATGEPLLAEGEIPLENSTFLRFRQCLVPLGHDEEEISAILGIMSFRTYDRKA